MRWYLSTTADLSSIEKDGSFAAVNSRRSALVAARCGMGLEIAEYCMTEYLDERAEEAERDVREKLRLAPADILHAPFNELFPAAIDPKAAALAVSRYEQALELAGRYGCEKTVIHSGYTPAVYFDEWFLSRSLQFWKRFLKEHPVRCTLCLENVMETSPDILRRLVESIDDPRVRICLDVGHAFRCSGRQPSEWLTELAPLVSHFHVHNNAGTFDTHSAPGDGSIRMEEFLGLARELCPDATYTVESLDVEAACAWLLEKGFLGA